MLEFACGCKKGWFFPNEHKISQNYCLECKEAMIGREVRFIRFGKAPESGRSWNYAEGCQEDGLSVYLIIDKVVGTIRNEFADRPAYIGKGFVCGIGGDDEILVKNFSMKKATKAQIKKYNL
jgi:hypothetical protein